jgi:hypothetical protein
MTHTCKTVVKFRIGMKNFRLEQTREYIKSTWKRD